MSKRIEATATCFCGKQYQVSLYRSLWVEHPENLQMVMDEKVNVFNCPYCNIEMNDESPFLCTNVTKGYAVWYDPHHDELVDKEIATYVLMFGPRNFYAEAPRISDYQTLKETILKYESGELKATPLDPERIRQAMKTSQSAQPPQSDGVGQKIVRFVAGLFGKSTSATTKLTTPPAQKATQRVEQETTSTRIVWERDANGELTDNGVKFDENDCATMFLSNPPNKTGAMFCTGAMLRRMLEPHDEEIAANWAGCKRHNGKLIWDIVAEQCFAEAFVEYCAITAEYDAPKNFKCMRPPSGLNRPPLTDELIEIFNDYQGKGNR